MSTPHPHSTADLALAPILISIERNLARLRTYQDLDFALALDLNDDNRWYQTATERAQRVQQSAIRDVNLHGWTVTPTATATAWPSGTASTPCRSCWVSGSLTTSGTDCPPSSPAVRPGGDRWHVRRTEPARARGQPGPVSPPTLGRAGRAVAGRTGRAAQTATGGPGNPPRVEGSARRGG